MRRAALAAAALVLLAGCGGDDDEKAPARTEETPPGVNTPAKPPDRNPGEPEVETVGTGLDTPWEIAFLPDRSALVTERPGRVRLLSRDLKLQKEPVAEVEVAEIGEGGLLGIAVDPRFRDNRFVYLYRTTNEGNQVVRYRFRGDQLTDEKVLVENIEAGPIHDGGRIRFGPDGRLYFATGEAGQEDLAQDQASLNGKMLRLQADAFRGDGGQPEVVSLGHRNAQGFDWNPRNGKLFASEHGPEANDEVNLIEEGANYGWPEATGEDHGGEFKAPIAVYPESIAPSGASFVALPGSEWSGDFLIACLVGEQIRRLRLGPSGVTINEPLFEGEFGRLRTVVEGPGGALYALTSNQDGRGTPREGDDRILRIVPPSES